MSDKLVAFLRAWLDWAEAGAPDGNSHTPRNPARFEPECGLCANTINFEETILDVHPEDTGDLEYELAGLFDADGLDRSYPFGDAAYDSDGDAGTHHKHEPRLAWVRGKLASVNVAST